MCKFNTNIDNMFYFLYILFKIYSQNSYRINLWVHLLPIIIPSLSGTWCQLSWSCSSCSYIVRLNCTSGRSSITGTELVRKGFPQVRKGTRAALSGYSQKEISQFDLELGLFVSKPGPIGSGGDGLRVGTEACDDQNTANGDG